MDMSTEINLQLLPFKVIDLVCMLAVVGKKGVSGKENIVKDPSGEHDSFSMIK